MSMKLLLDECVTRRIKRLFIGHEVSTIEEAGFKGLRNGELLIEAAKRFDVLVTVAKNIEYQQNTISLPMSVLILSARTNRFESLSPLATDALSALTTIRSGEIIRIEA